MHLLIVLTNTVTIRRSLPAYESDLQYVEIRVKLRNAIQVNSVVIQNDFNQRVIRVGYQAPLSSHGGA